MLYSVHLFDVEADAQNAVTQLDVAGGYPRQETDHYTIYYLWEGHGQWFIFATPFTMEILATPVEEIELP